MTEIHKQYYFCLFIFTQEWCFTYSESGVWAIWPCKPLSCCLWDFVWFLLTTLLVFILAVQYEQVCNCVQQVCNRLEWRWSHLIITFSLKAETKCIMDYSQSCKCLRFYFFIESMCFLLTSFNEWTVHCDSLYMTVIIWISFLQLYCAVQFSK